MNQNIAETSNEARTLLNFLKFRSSDSMNIRNLGLALVAPICWGVSFTLAKPAVTHFPPLFMMLLVYLGIALIMAFTQRTSFRTPWPHLLLISAFAVIIQGALLFYAVRDVEATTANLVLQTQVPAAVILGWLLAGEKLDAAKVIGTFIAIVGVGIVIGLPEHRPPLFPVLMIVVSGFFWAAGQVCGVRGILSGLCHVVFGVKDYEGR
jgi:O-acetylserine/cysteine efflux transporter